jgi:hypothetical protein
MAKWGGMKCSAGMPQQHTHREASVLVGCANGSLVGCVNGSCAAVGWAWHCCGAEAHVGVDGHVAVQGHGWPIQSSMDPCSRQVRGWEEVPLRDTRQIRHAVILGVSMAGGAGLPGQCKLPEV